MGRLDEMHAILEEARPSGPIQFPEPDGDRSVQLTRQKTYGAWAGQGDRLVRIFGLVDEALRSAFSDWQEDADRAGQNQIERRHEAQFFVPEVVVSGAGGVQRTGPIETILAEMDLQDIKAVRMGNGQVYRPGHGPMPHVSVELGYEHPWPIGHLQEPVRITVAGSNRQWVGGSIDALNTELQKDVPSWAWLKSMWVGNILSWLFLAAGVGALPGWLLWERGFLSGWVLTGWVTLSLVTGLLLQFAADKWVTRDIEVLDVGARPAARRFVAGLGTLVTLTLGVAGVVLAVL